MTASNTFIRRKMVLELRLYVMESCVNICAQSRTSFIQDTTTRFSLNSVSPLHYLRQSGYVYHVCTTQPSQGFIATS